MDETKLLAGFCMKCLGWSYFTRGVDEEKCLNCGGHFTNKIGYQITTQRSLRPKAKEREFGENISQERRTF